MTSADKGEQRTLLVILDVNVWLDVANHVGAPFDWSVFDGLVASLARAPVPHPTDTSLDSLRALATMLSGRHLGSALEVWSGEHIEDLAFSKLTQDSYEVVDEDRGLGWADEDAIQFLEVCHDDVLVRTSGLVLPNTGVADESPPLSHEDGLVHRVANNAGRDEHGWYERYCITRDKGYRTADLGGEVDVLYPWEWVEKIRSERRRAIIGKMPKPASP